MLANFYAIMGGLDRGPSNDKIFPFTGDGSSYGYAIDFSDWSTLFQDTAGTVPITAAGQQIARANDVGGRSINFTQATAGRRPISAISLGVKSAYFDGTDDFINHTLGSPILGLYNGRKFYAGIKARPDGANSNEGSAVAFHKITTTQQMWTPFTRQEANYCSAAVIRGGALVLASASDYMTGNTWNTYSAIDNSPSTTAAASTFSYYKNGVSVANVAYTSPAGNNQIQTFTDYFIGARFLSTTPTYTSFYKGNISRAIFTNHATLSADNIKVIESWIKGSK